MLKEIGGGGGDNEGDVLLQQAIELVQRQQGVSASLLHCKLRIGYPKATRLIDHMEGIGVVGPPEGAGELRAVIAES